MPDGSAQEHIGRKAVLKGQRANHESEWTEIKRYFTPHAGDFNTKTSRGENKTRYIYEGTALDAIESWTAAWTDFTTPHNRRWHRTVPSDPVLAKDPQVKEWFADLDDVLFRFRNSPRARFSGQKYEFDRSQGAFGNGCLFVDELSSGGTRYKYNHVGDTYIEVNFEGIVDTVYYEYELTAKAAMQRWGDKTPAPVRAAHSASPFATFSFLHVVQPNENFDPERQDAAGMAFESIEICIADQSVIERGGYHEMPYIWGRYTVIPGEVYGRGPASLALDDVKTLQEMERVYMRSGHKVADPPLLVAKDGALGRGSKRVRIAPGGMNFGGLSAAGTELIKPLHTGARLDFTEVMMEKKREAIRRRFNLHLIDILIQDRIQMTATEVLERRVEKGRLISPTVGRQQAETMGPLIAREIGIAQRQGFVGPLPDALVEAQGDYEIEYESSATRMQQADDAAAMSRLIEVMSPFIEADPSVMNNAKADEVWRHMSEVLGVPMKLNNTEQEKDKIDQAQLQAAEEAARMEQAQAGAGVLRDVSAAGAA